MRIITYLTLLLLLMACEETPQKEPLVLWYDSPARNWDEALPIGNGRSGAMIFGRTDNEQLQLNENTLYSGEPSVVFKDVKITPEMFDKVVGLMKAGKYRSLRSGLQELARTLAPVLSTVRRLAYPKQQTGRG